MPSTDENGKRLGGAAQNRKARGSAQPVPEALPAEFDAGAVPEDPIDLQVWGCKQLALLARMKATQPAAVNKQQHDGIRNDLATMGMLFPRAELVRRLKKAKQTREGDAGDKELKPLHGIDPGPTGRAGRGPRG